MFLSFPDPYWQVCQFVFISNVELHFFNALLVQTEEQQSHSIVIYLSDHYFCFDWFYVWNSTDWFAGWIKSQIWGRAWTFYPIVRFIVLKCDIFKHLIHFTLADSSYWHVNFCSYYGFSYLGSFSYWWYSHWQQSWASSQVKLYLFESRWYKCVLKVASLYTAKSIYLSQGLWYFLSICLIGIWQLIWLLVAIVVNILNQIKCVLLNRIVWMRFENNCSRKLLIGSPKAWNKCF